MMFDFLKPKFKVPVDRHSDYIVERMMLRGHTWFGANKYQMRNHFWGFLKDEFGIKQKYSWREKRNYMVFKDENHYLTFLIKL